jgi:dihydroorotase
MRLGLPAIPACAGSLSALAPPWPVTGSRVHLSRLSTREGVACVREAKRDGLAVTCDVAINHLHLCDADIGWFDAHCHLVPPLRGVEDRQALRGGLADGTIDLLCSDHTPVDDDGKQLPFAEAEPGATGLELMLPLTLKWAREDGMPLATALARVTTDPARILGVDAGHLAVGAPADVCIFDPERRWTVEPAALKSQGKNTPFLGLELQGRVGYTLVNGQIVHEA